MKKILLIFNGVSVSLSSLSYTMSCSFNKSNIDQIIDIDDIDFDDTTLLDIVEAWQVQASSVKEDYRNKVNKDWKNKYESLVSSEQNKKKLDVDLYESTPISVRSQRMDGVHLGMDSFGYYYPLVSELHEIERFEIPNYNYLDKIGFELYVSKEDKNEVIDYINVDMSNTYKDKDNDKVYYKVNNTTKTGCLYYKSSDSVTKNNSGLSATLSFIAVNRNDKSVLKTIPDAYGRSTVTVTVAKSYDSSDRSFINYRLGDWLKFEYANDETFLCYELGQIVLIYYQMIINYMNNLIELDKYPEYAQKKPLLNGFVNIASKDSFSEDSVAAMLYYAYRYNSIFDLFTIMMKDGNLMTVLVNQNYRFDETIEFPSDLSLVTNDNEERRKLDFNPTMQFPIKAKNFISHVWDLLLKLNTKLDNKFKNVENEDSYDKS